MMESKFYLFDTVCLMGKCPNCGSKINEIDSLGHSNHADKNYKCLDCGWSITIDEEFKSAALLLIFEKSKLLNQANLFWSHASKRISVFVKLAFVKYRQQHLLAIRIYYAAQFQQYMQ